MKFISRGMLTACLFYPLLLNAQNEIDALRYSQNIFGSTARSLSMGGAFGALGADISCLSNNPAGIGVYRKSEFTVSLGFNNRNSEADFQGNISNNNRFNINVPDLGLVLSFPKKGNSEWKQFGFALGYNRINSFSSHSYYEGKNDKNSILDSFTESVNQSGGASTEDLANYFPFDADLAYQTYLLDPDPNIPNNYISVIPNGGAFQSRDVVTRGSQGEFSLGFGGNYNDLIYFGATVGFPGIRFEQESTYEENDKDNTIINSDSTVDFKSLRYYQYLKTTGNGINAKFGLIFRPADWVRIGAAIHTPTYYYLTDNYNSSMRSSFGDGSKYEYLSPEGSYSYNLTTPFKAIGSLAFLFGQNGLISFDYEFTDYSAASLHASDYSFSDENKIIRNIYSDAASNFKGGVEWKYDNFSFRGGVAYYSTPFRSGISDTKSDQHLISYTGGIGYREKSYFFDIGYGYARSSDFYRQYTLTTEPVPGTTTKRGDHRVIATLGFRF